jgi:hypothetical protein
MLDVVISRLTPRNGSIDKSQFLSEINIGTSRLTPRKAVTSDCHFSDGVYDRISKDIVCITFGTSDSMFLNLSIKLSVIVLNNINDAIYPWSDDSTATCQVWLDRVQTGSRRASQRALRPTRPGSGRSVIETPRDAAARRQSRTANLYKYTV